MKRKTHMTEDEYKAFVEDCMSTVQGDRGSSATLMDVLKAHGLEPDLHEAVAKKLEPLLNTEVGSLSEIAHNCSWCPSCGLCTACGELNAASAGAFAASAVHVLD